MDLHAAKTYENLEKHAEGTERAFQAKVAEWKKRNESRADLASLRDESDHEEYSSILTELAASEIIWKDYVRSALARADPEELEEVNIIAEQRDQMITDAEAWCQKVGLRTGDCEKLKVQARTIPEWRRAFLTGSYQDRKLLAMAELQALQLTQFLWAERGKSVLDSSQSANLKEETLLAPENILAIKRIMSSAPRPEARVRFRRGEFDAYRADDDNTSSAGFAAYDVGRCAPSYSRRDMCWRARVDDWIRFGGSKSTRPDGTIDVFLSTEDPGKLLTSKARGIHAWHNATAIHRLKAPIYNSCKNVRTRLPKSIGPVPPT